ncbi:hypothetical protein PYCCODRAFT_1132864 [Trametes coccinea BRFM310]|uniref:Uncharacterized protein n=1 Tax=Trametes coccinea (strain BRFM310) TaxID=1353009 RepID=A0A1Y2IAQ7_TRAC3|nr:hypothetical protein PYCCODRAFT_1132864 [Trametes coccinea BRFM310]
MLSISPSKRPADVYSSVPPNAIITLAFYVDALASKPTEGTEWKKPPTPQFASPGLCVSRSRASNSTKLRALVASDSLHGSADARKGSHWPAGIDWIGSAAASCGCVALRGRRARWYWVAGCSEIPGAGTNRVVASAVESSVCCRLLPAMFPLGLVGQYTSIRARRLNIHSSTAAHLVLKNPSAVHVEDPATGSVRCEL